jgi:xanthine dehydrogenase accessory factor
MTCSIFDQLVAASAEGQPAALGVITSVKGSSPQKIGAKALFFADGRIQGTLGGGCLEAEIQDRARRALVTQTPAKFELVLDHDFGWDDGLICGGKVSGVILPKAAEAVEIWRELAARAKPRTWEIREDFTVGWASGDTGWVYQETVRPPCALWIAGAGHIAQAVAPLALKLDFDTLVFDDRPGLANHHYFPLGTRFKVGSWQEMFQAPQPEVPAFGLIVTRGHRHDALVLRHWLQRRFVFLGMIGSSRKWRLIRSEFLEEGIASAEALDQVACPVGLELHAVSVQEIAVSIMAQYIQKRAEIGLERAAAQRVGAAVGVAV